jgi:glycosyltransferase involved in cell wall biosynthesis
MKFPFYGGGSGTYVRKLGENLAKQKGYKVALVAPDERPIKGCKIYTIKPAFKAVFESHPEYKRAKKYSKLTGYEFSRQYLAYMRDIVAAVEDFKPDVIHVNHSSYLMWIASFIKSMFGISYVVTIHGTDIYNATIDPRYRIISKQALERAEWMLPVSYHTKKWFLKVFGKGFNRKVKVISNGLNIEDYNPNRMDKGMSSVLRKYNLEGKKYVVFAGRLTFEKGVDYLIKAAKDIDAEVLIIGDGVYKKYLQNYTKLVGAKNVRFLGYFGKDSADDLKRIYHGASALVLPSTVEESTGLVILEAMACGTPVVASNKGGIPMVVKDGLNGFLVRAKSSKEIAEAVNKILTNPKLEAKLRANARKTVEERFDWTVLVKTIMNSYDKAFLVTERMQKSISRAIFPREELMREKEELQKKLA